MFYLVQRMDGKRFRPSDHIARACSHKLGKTVNTGVEIMIYDVSLDLKVIRLHKSLPHHI
jgi:DNA-binding sugar fermentation-stimulating protein